jgi:hypothetical protein
MVVVVVGVSGRSLNQFQKIMMELRLCEVGVSGRC